MLKFNRKTEYGLIALRYLAQQLQQDEDRLVSAREISNAYKIPYPVLSKVLQQLQAKGLIHSVQGTRGGYALKRCLHEITLADLVEVFEGPLGVTDCLCASELGCFLNDVCNVKMLFANLNERIGEMLAEINLQDLSQFESQPQTDKATLRAS